ncbi:MAG TPA: hypothetical protein PLT66_08905 [Bacillota bacterium]|nr:hypothetical protein [Bacillota bacterium]
MHIYTVRLTNLKFFAVVLLAVGALAVLASLLPGISTPVVNAAAPELYEGVDDNDARIAFLESFGY